MDKGVGPINIEAAWSVAEGRQVFQIAWTTEQLQQIGQAVEEGDEAFLATVETAMRVALDAVMKPPHTNSRGRMAYRSGGRFR